MTRTQLKELAELRGFLRTGAARSVRVAAGISLGEAAQASRVSPSTIHRWENGTRIPRGAPGLRYWRVLRSLMERSNA